MTTIAAFWLLLLALTGFRIIERSGRVAVTKNRYVFNNVLLNSLLVGIVTTALVTLFFFAAMGVFFLLAPSYATRAAMALGDQLVRWFDPSVPNYTAFAITFILSASFLIAPLFYSLGRKLHRPRRSQLMRLFPRNGGHH